MDEDDYEVLRQKNISERNAIVSVLSFNETINNLTFQRKLKFPLYRVCMQNISVMI